MWTEFDSQISDGWGGRKVYTSLTCGVSRLVLPRVCLLSSAVEHFRGKEGVLSSILKVGLTERSYGRPPVEG